MQLEKNSLKGEIKMDNEKMLKEALEQGIEYYKKGRILVWHDEFDGDKLDMDKWVFHRTMSTADRIYDNSEKNCRVENGEVHMQSHRTDDPEHPFTLSEGLTTKFTMNWKYGYLEMRAKVPYRHGAWPSFWTQSSTVFKTTPWMAEADIFEVFSNDSGLASALHKWGYSQHCSVGGGWYKVGEPETINEEYHIYGYEWNPEYMAFFVDGKEQWRTPIDAVNGNFKHEVIDGTSGFHDFQFIIFNNELFTEGSSWKPNGWAINDDDQFPIDYYIDWVRLYQNPEKEELKLKPEIDEVIAQKKAEEEAKAKEENK